MASLDWDSLRAALDAQGWVTTKLRSGHFRTVPPNGQRMIHFGKSGDFRALKNTIGYLRASGFVWPPTASPSAPAVDPAPVHDPTQPDAPACQPGVASAKPRREPRSRRKRASG